ncbi:MAG: sulfite exporter TauE/SafE family protein, partial [Longimicrobiales bacterium]
LILLYATALLVGSVHALEADHMAAVTSFAVRRPRWRDAVGFGLRWALGHGAAVVIAGAIILLVGIRIPQGATHALERLVGLVLIGLGGWTLKGARRMHAHRHVHADGTSHVHLHSHAFVRDHDHRHGATAVGMLHGLAGTAPAVALVPVAGFESAVQGVIYLLLFAVGTAGGMALYALLAGLVVGRAAFRSERLARTIAVATGCMTIAVGGFWLMR